MRDWGLSFTRPWVKQTGTRDVITKGNSEVRVLCDRGYSMAERLWNVISFGTSVIWGADERYLNVH